MIEGSRLLLRCPVCSAPLAVSGGACKCPARHSFDIAKEGYANLLPANRKHSQKPGDDAEMSLARNRFLSSGSYAPLAEALCALCVELTPDRPCVIDSGCGEGYYSEHIFTSLESSGKVPSLAGIDLSRPSLKKAAKRCREGQFALASVYHLPLADGCADMLINCFSPLALDEFRRIIQAGGYFIYVVPAPRHLWELKQVLYDEPYLNTEENIPYEGFEYVRVVPLSFSMELDAGLLADLFRMTPYYWKTPREGTQRLSAVDGLNVTADFRIHVFSRK